MESALEISFDDVEAEDCNMQTESSPYFSESNKRLPEKEPGYTSFTEREKLIWHSLVNMYMLINTPKHF
jgi:hypothetical protein